MEEKPAFYSASPVRILIVDDHPNTANTLARAVSQLGGRVEAIAATNGQEALERVRDRAADILITDMIMPEMNGLELVEKLQNHPGGRPTHVILITAYDVPGLKETARRARVDEIIVKPVRPERICQIVSRLLEKWNHTQPPEPTGVEKTSKFRILVADDLPDNVTLLARYLQNEGYDYLTAADGEETLQSIRALQPDLVLLDVNMPKKDGFTVLEEIRADLAIQHIPVIILTAARLDPTDVHSGLNLGADDYVTKPFDRRELMARIRTKLRVKEANDALRRRNRELSLLLEATGILNGRGKLETMLDDVLQLIAGRLGAGAGYFLNFEDSTSRSFPHYATRLDTVPLKRFLGDSRHSNRTCLVDDTQADDFWKAELGETVHSAALASISDRRGELIGAILLTHNVPSYFTPEQVTILNAIANQIAVTLENAAWYAAPQGGSR